MDDQPPNPDTWLRDARVRVLERDGVTRIRLGGPSPLMTFIYTFVLAAVLEGFAYPIAAMLYNPAPVPVWLMTLGAGGAVLLGVLLALRRRAVIDSGRADLVIDDAARTLALPWTFGRDCETLVPFDRITEIAMAEEVARHEGARRDVGLTDDFGPKRYVKMTVAPDDAVRDTGGRVGAMRMAVMVCRRTDDGTVMEAPIVRWSGCRRARGLVLWLRDRLSV